LVAGLDVADKHGRARYLLKGPGDLINGSQCELLSILELHAVDRVFEQRHWGSLKNRG